MSARLFCGCCSAALLTSTSSLPNSCTVRWTSCWQNVFVADVARVGDAAPAFLLDEPLRLLRIAVLVQVGDGHVRAFTRK